MGEFAIGEKVEVISGCENDNGDDHLIGKVGVIKSVDGDYYEVLLDGETQTNQFGEYQLAFHDDPNDRKFVFEVTLVAKAKAVDTLGFEFDVPADGTTELWDILESKGVSYGDVMLITLKGETDDNRAVCDAVRRLDEAGFSDVCLSSYFPNFDTDLHLVASVQEGYLIEFRILDRLVNWNTMYHFYDYRAALEFLNGWPKGF